MDEDILQEKIKAYRESLKEAKPDLDVALLMRILDMVNGDSEIKVAINPIAEGGEWDPKAPTYAVNGVKEMEDRRLALRVSDEKHGIAAYKLEEQYKKHLKHSKGEKMPVLFTRKGEVVKLTDVFSHALVREMWAGMPFDVVLAVKENRPSAE